MGGSGTVSKWCSPSDGLGHGVVCALGRLNGPLPCALAGMLGPSGDDRRQDPERPGASRPKPSTSRPTTRRCSTRADGTHKVHSANVWGLPDDKTWSFNASFAERESAVLMLWRNYNPALSAYWTSWKTSPQQGPRCHPADHRAVGTEPPPSCRPPGPSRVCGSSPRRRMVARGRARHRAELRARRGSAPTGRRKSRRRTSGLSPTIRRGWSTPTSRKERPGYSSSGATKTPPSARTGARGRRAPPGSRSPASRSCCSPVAATSSRPRRARSRAFASWPRPTTAG